MPEYSVSFVNSPVFKKFPSFQAAQEFAGGFVSATRHEVQVPRGLQLQWSVYATKRDRTRAVPGTAIAIIYLFLPKEA